jgi:hypothetical protein
MRYLLDTNISNVARPKQSERLLQWTSEQRDPARRASNSKPPRKFGVMHHFPPG